MANSKKRCKQCKKYQKAETIIETNSGNFCSNQCRADWGLSNIEKLKKKVFAKNEKDRLERKRENKKKKRDNESISTYEKRVQELYFNHFIRLRDDKKPCIMCGTYISPIWDAGHYRSIGSCSQLRFEELNVHKQCRHCNSFKEKTPDYRINLVKKIGLKKVEWLEGPHLKIKRTREEIKSIESLYKFKLKEIKKTTLFN